MVIRCCSFGISYSNKNNISLKFRYELHYRDGCKSKEVGEASIVGDKEYGNGFRAVKQGTKTLCIYVYDSEKFNRCDVFFYGTRL